MGVRGLMTFVENNRGRLYDKEKLHDCPLVIDGFGLAYHLYFEKNLDSRHGGEFARFAEIIAKFFKQLKICGIKPHVIFDGPIEPDKLPCVLSRLNDRVNDVNYILKNEGNARVRILPIFAVDVLFNYLSTHQIPYAVTIKDADSEIVAVANVLECSVLSLDSDYYIYNIKNGYIPFEDFNWGKICSEKGSKKSIICNKYKITNMVREYGVSENVLPYLSVLLGNDWLPKDTFAELLNKLPQPRSLQRQKPSKRRKRDQKIDSLLWWLSTKSSEKSVHDKIRNTLPNKKRDEMMGRVETCVALYRNITDVKETLNALKSTTTGESLMKISEEDIYQLVRTSNIHPTAINLLESKYICLPVPMHDSRKCSPHVCAAELRTIFYRILLRKYRFKTAGAEFLFLQEYDKVDLSYKKSRTVSVFTSLCPMCEQHHSFEEMCAMPPSDDFKSETCSICTKLILRSLKLNSSNSFLNHLSTRQNFELFDSDFIKIFDIVMTSTLFWYKRTSPSPRHVCVLLSAIIWSVSQCLNKKSRTLKRNTNVSKATSGNDCISGEISSSTGAPDSQLKSLNVVNSNIDINKIVANGSPAPKIGSFYSRTSLSKDDASVHSGTKHESKVKVVMPNRIEAQGSRQTHENFALPTEGINTILASQMDTQNVSYTKTKGNNTKTQIGTQNIADTKPNGTVSVSQMDTQNEPFEQFGVDNTTQIDAQNTGDHGIPMDVNNSPITTSKVLEQSDDSFNDKTTSSKEQSSATEYGNISPDNTQIENLSAEEMLSKPDENFDTTCVVDSQQFSECEENGKHETNAISSSVTEVHSNKTSKEDIGKDGVKSSDRSKISLSQKESTSSNFPVLSGPQKSKETEQQLLPKDSAESSFRQDGSKISQSVKFVTISVYKFLDLFGSAQFRTASGATEKLDYGMDIELLHSASEWLCILNAAVLLHHAVEGQRSSFTMQDFLTSNVLLHDINTRIKRLQSLTENAQKDLKLNSDVIADCLGTVPNLRSLFQDLVDFLSMT